VSLPITSVGSSIPSLTPSSSPSPAAKTDGGGFGESLGKLIESADESSKAANEKVSNMLTGNGDVHDAMIALQRAELSLQLTIQVRNKVVQAYQDIMRMPV
jgi:flagellar hook-basal body complex protein FliE